jgi:hypothetical protein
VLITLCTSVIFTVLPDDDFFAALFLAAAFLAGAFFAGALPPADCSVAIVV